MLQNLKIKIRIVQEIIPKHYEAGRQDRSYKAVWRNFIYPIYPMCYRTYLNYINTGNLQTR